MNAALALLLLGQAAAAEPQVGPPGSTLPTAQREAADRLLAATGASDRREQQIDEIAGQLLMFTNPRCALMGGDTEKVEACAAKNKVGRALIRRIAAAKPELLAAATEIQERAYASRMSVTEMDAVTAFATTPAGLSFFRAAPPAAIEAGKAVRVLVTTRVRAIVDQLQAEQPSSDTVVEPD